MPTSGRYVVVRYVSDLIRDEPINIGVVLQERDVVRAKFAEPDDLAKMLKDEDRQLIRDWTAGFRAEIEALISHVFPVQATQPNFLEKLRETHPYQFRFSEPRGTLFEDFATELEELFQTYVELKQARTRQYDPGLDHARHLFRQTLRLRQVSEDRVRIDYTLRAGKSDFRVDFVLNGLENRYRIWHFIYLVQSEEALKERVDAWAHRFHSLIDERKSSRNDIRVFLGGQPDEQALRRGQDIIGEHATILEPADHIVKEEAERLAALACL